MIQSLFITANVGSIFQDPKHLFKIWIGEFLKTVDLLKPNFIALHCQEFGGKNYRKQQNHVDDFVRGLISSKELMEFEHFRIFIDEDFTSDDKFTALGSFYFIHKTQKAYIWNFDIKSFVPANGKEIHSGSIDSVPVKFKVKFPQEFFPECKWSRKGFMRTRWHINGTIFDTINIHLFHDESNFISISEFPSTYAKNRRKAFEYTLGMINKNDFDFPVFIFGDFNFRLDTRKVIQRLTANTKLSQKKTKAGELSRLLYQDVTNGRRLSIEKKHFFYSDQNFFTDIKNRDWLLKQDKEPNYFNGTLYEFERNFLPSYPFEESSSSMNYMNTRCPSWCDRVLMNSAAKKLIDENKQEIKYELIGFESSMGDHKPVYLYFELAEQKSPTEDLNHSSMVGLKDTIYKLVSNNDVNDDDDNSDDGNNESCLTIKKYYYFRFNQQQMPKSIIASSSSSMLNTTSTKLSSNNIIINLSKETSV